ncbi:MAG: hypothetical protein M3416_00425 [Acidobacteriota bacterium]|nr:hypothetical protein [Acidobacteriota bacterium]
MTTESGKAPNERRESEQRKERGGAADIDRSKGLGTEEAGSPFDNPGKDAAEPKKKAPTG